MQADTVAAEAFRDAAPIATALLSKQLILRVGMEKTVLQTEHKLDAPCTVQGGNPAAPQFALRQLPLPFTYEDCVLTEKDWPVRAATLVGEQVDATILGKEYVMPIFGLGTHPDRITRQGWDVPDERLLKDAGYDGPYLRIVPWHLPSRCFGDQKGNVIYSKQVSGNSRFVLNAAPDTIRLVVGLDPVLVQWEDHFKFLCIIVPQIRVAPGRKAGIVQCR